MANCGGILGLCMGFSIVTVFEVLHYLVKMTLQGPFAATRLEQSILSTSALDVHRSGMRSLHTVIPEGLSISIHSTQ